MIRETKRTKSAVELAQTISKRLSETLQEAGKRLSDSSAEGALARGKVFQIGGYYAEAIESYSDALALDSDLDEAAARLAIVQLAADQLDEGLMTATVLAARNSGFEFKESTSDQYVSAMTVLGDALAHNGRTTDAIEAYQVARNTSRRDTFAAARLAQLYLVTGQAKKALEQAGDVAKNPRFRDFSLVMSLGAKSEALLPRFALGDLRALLRVAVPGRPLLVDGRARLASIVSDDDSWCAQLPE